MANGVYALCAITCIVCAGLLARGYVRSKARLLLWSTLCFAALTVNNILLVVDRVVFLEEIDLYRLRLVTAVMAVALLVYGLIWDVDR
ncbi:MAG: hypothetical protein KY391_03955 [Actinobacteria bacterium]|nr:hypothetical protein [Actinomycetota bacterium]